MERDLIRRDRFGTIGFLAPEALVGFKKIDYKVDTWSLGVLLFLMISGELPFNGSELQIKQQTLKKDIKFDDPIWENYSPAALDLISNLLRKDCNHRLTLNEILDHQWL